MRCIGCNSENASGAKFCSKCGAPLASAGRGVASFIGGEIHKAVQGERRHLTVLFCDLVGSTEMATRLDPEEWHEIASEYHRTASDAAVRYGGYVAQFQGDGVLVYFGYPTAEEDSAERAVRAALSIIDAVATLNSVRGSDRGRPLLSVRIGIHSGAVVVGRGSGGETAAFGETPNIAARIQSVAEADSAVITAATHRLVPGLFVIKELGVRKFKGLNEPFELFRVVRSSGVRSRLHAALAARGLTPFVGRERELARLWERWVGARAGEQQAVVISGEAGIGKSRLVQEFRQRLITTPHTWIECGATPFLQNTPFHTVTEMLRQALVVDGNEEQAEPGISDLERAVAEAGLEAREAVPLFAKLLSLPIPDQYLQSFLSPERERRQQLVLLTAWITALARQQPLVVVIEDLHWVDPSTLELLTMLNAAAAPAPMLLLYTARPEFRSPWTIDRRRIQLNLTGLSREQAREMIESAAHDFRMPDELVQTVVERTGGVPLFVEEMTRAVADGGGVDHADRIPSTLRDSLMARLDRLGQAREIAQVGAVIGHDFSYDLISAVAPVARVELDEMLSRLVEAEMLYVRGTPPAASYLFKHALVRDTAYEALLRSRRREFHRKIAAAITERTPEAARAQPEMLAHHFSEAGDQEHALAAWRRAAESASGRGALIEAEGHYRRALDALGAMPESAERDQLELVLQLGIGQVAIATRGYMAQETAAAYDRARELGQRSGSPRRTVQVLSGLFAIPLLRGEMRATQAICEQLLAAARRDGSAVRMVWAHYLDGVASYHRGDLAHARECFANASALYAETDFRGDTQDPGSEALEYAALASWQLGLADTARQRIGAALALAERLHKPYATAHSQFYAGFLHALLRDPGATRRHAEAVVALSRERRFPHFVNSGRILLGWALGDHGDAGGVITDMRDALNAYMGSGNRLAIGVFLGFLAETLARAGNYDEALRTIDEAIDGSAEQLVDQAHLRWLRGAVLLQRASAESNSANRGDLEAAEQSFQQTVALAGQIGAKFYALRAATSLARMRRARGDREAASLLEPFFENLVEGFDTADAIEAKTLLAELN